MSKSQPYYFPHYMGARNDNKILKLRRILGLEGYAIYFMLLEVLREQNGFKYPVESIPELEFDLRVSKEKISNVIFDYELFTVDDKNFFSPRLIEYLQPYLEKVERAKTAALIRWGNNENAAKEANADANALPEQSKSNAINLSKVSNISKDNEEIKKEFYDSLTPFISKYSREMLRDFYDYWIEESENGKLRFKGEKYFSVSRRLATWHKNEKNPQSSNPIPNRKRLSHGS